MKKLLLILPLVAGFAMAGDGKSLFEAKCSSCHIMGMPTDKSKLIAPPARGITMHLKMAHPDKDGFEKFLVDYVINPDAKKALCRKETIKRFGVMPSQKGNVTEDELKSIAEFLYENYAKGNPQMMQGKGQGRGMGCQRGVHQGQGMNHGMHNR
jgi:cytochrome c